MRVGDYKPTYDIVEQKSGRLEAACMRYGLGKNTMRDLATKAGAVIRIGKIWLCNYTVMDSYLDSLSSKESENSEQ